MNVFVIANGQDTGGYGIHVKQAFDRYAGHDWSVRQMCSSKNFLNYPIDHEWNKELAKQFYDWADVLNCQQSVAFLQLVGNPKLVPTVLHNQGTRLRENPRLVEAEGKSIGATMTVSTIDLQLSLRGYSLWVPAPFDVDGLRVAYRRPRRGKGASTVRICHSPTNRRVKSTELILDACDRVARYYDIEMALIEKQSWEVAQSRKGRCDIFIDQLKLGYGNAAIEAWSMGLPVICGVASERVRAKMIATWGELPFYEATPTNIETKISELAASKELREEWGQRGYEHVKKWHDEPSVVEHLKAIYRAAKPTKKGLRLADVVNKRMFPRTRAA